MAKVKRRFWSTKETQSLIKGYKIYGTAWKAMLLDSDLYFAQRTSTNLRDRYRTLGGEEYFQLLTQQKSAIGEITKIVDVEHRNDQLFYKVICDIPGDVWTRAQFNNPLWDELISQYIERLNEKKKMILDDTERRKSMQQEQDSNIASGSAQESSERNGYGETSEASVDSDFFQASEGPADINQVTLERLRTPNNCSIM